MAILWLIIGLLLFVGLIILHEFGHFIMAKRNGVEVEEFGIGFPPRAKTLTKKNGTEYTLNWLPIGGFVKLKGEHDSDTEPGTYGAASTTAKIKIMMAGVVMNLAAALVLLTGLGFVGIPTLINSADHGEDQFTVARDERIVTEKVLIGSVSADSPAEQAGIQRLDTIVAVTDDSGIRTDIRTRQQLTEINTLLAGQTVTVTFEQNGELRDAPLTLRTTEESQSFDTDGFNKGYMGVVLSDYEVRRYTWSSPVVAVGLAGQMTKLTANGLWSALSGFGKMLVGLVTNNSDVREKGQIQATEQVSGPLGIFYILKYGAQQGANMIFFIVAIISLTLAIMNALPIPALDGGRLFVTLLFRALRRPLSGRAEELIHGTGFAALMILFLLITIVDVKRFV